MDDLKVFEQNEFGKLDYLFVNGKKYFPAKECAEILGYKNPCNAIKIHCKKVYKILAPTNGGPQIKHFITESDLYRLIAKSKLKTAEKFEELVFEYVFPSIKKIC